MGPRLRVLLVASALAALTLVAYMGGTDDADPEPPPVVSEATPTAAAERSPTSTATPTPTATVAPTGGSAATDRAALVALYNATDGANWTNSTNWLSNMPVGEWFGVTADGSGRVIALELNENGLRVSIPAELGGLAKLEVLALSRNELTGPIPAELGDLTNLQALFLWGNRLSGPIPAELGGLANLRELSLYSNNLERADSGGVASDRESGVPRPRA